MSRMRLLAVVGVVAVALGAVGSTLAAGPDKSGGSPPITLTLADSNTELPVDFPAAQRFVDRVEELSGGAIKIDVRENYADASEPPFIAAGKLVPALRSGAVDLAVFRAASLDTVGIHGLDAFFAPMLVDSNALQKAILTGPIGRDLLASTTEAGVVPLALLPMGLAKPWGVRALPRTPGAFKKQAVLALPTTETYAATVRALGGRPTVRDTDAWSILVTDLHNYATNSRFAPYLVSNVTLYPRALAVLGSEKTFAKLTDKQRGWISQAANDATDYAFAGPGSQKAEQAELVASCKAGRLKAAEATDAEVAAFRSAFAPVLARLSQNGATKALIGRIEALKATITPDRLAIPAGCAPKPSKGTPSKRAFPASGTFRYTLTKDEIRAYAPGMPADAVRSNVGTYTWTFRGRAVSLVQTGCACSFAASHWKGTYSTANDVLTVRWAVDRSLCNHHCVEIVRWRYDGKALRFGPVGGQELDVTWSKPWIRLR